jgi:hypothetical protein
MNCIYDSISLFSPELMIYTYYIGFPRAKCSYKMKNKKKRKWKKNRGEEEKEKKDDFGISPVEPGNSFHCELYAWANFLQRYDPDFNSIVSTEGGVLSLRFESIHFGLNVTRLCQCTQPKGKGKITGIMCVLWWVRVESRNERSKNKESQRESKQKKTKRKDKQTSWLSTQVLQTISVTLKNY